MSGFSRRLGAAALALAGLTAAAFSLHSTGRDSNREAVNALAAARSAVGHDGTFDNATTRLLTVEIDADGVRLLQAIAKPDLRYVAPPMDPSRRPFQWILYHADGSPLATGGFDPAKLCLDPSHRGQPAHMEGCVCVPHVAHCNVKIPDLPGAARIDFISRDGATGAQRPFGSFAATAWKDVR